MRGLEAIRNEVLRPPLPESVFESHLISLRRDVDRIMESGAAQIANRAQSALTFARREEISLEDLLHFAASISLNALRVLQQEMLDSSPLVLATSPDAKVLERIGNWAAS